MLGIDERELAAIFTAQTAGEALNSHPHLHGLIADGYGKDGMFTRFAELDLAAIEKAFAKRVLAQLHKLELITDDKESTCIVETRSPLSSQPIFRHRNTHKFLQYKQ